MTVEPNERLALMKIIVIGEGGREHALVKKLAESEEVEEITCFPGSHAIGLERLITNDNAIRTVPGIGVTDAKEIANFAQETRADLVIPGPEACLEAGVGDLCRKYGIPFAGPCSRGARLETSKAFQFQFLCDSGIPRPAGEICHTVSSARAFAAKHLNGVAVKADGMAFGKGVLLCSNPLDSDVAINRLMVSRECGRAGDVVVMQERVKGRGEISLHVVTDAKSALLLETACDYKREGVGDTGENTGGIGGFSPGPVLKDETIFKIREHLLERWRRGCENEGIVYRGILYPGLMLVGEVGIRVLEFNARFGDPETQVFLRRFTGDLAKLMYASATDTLEKSMLSWSPEPSVGVVLCSEGYPRRPKVGREIAGLDVAAKVPDVEIFHNGTLNSGGNWLSNGGRIVTVTAIGSKARESAYEAISRIHCEGSWFRHDIAEHLK